MSGGDGFGVVLAAAGAGRRFGGPKQLLLLRGRPVLHFSIDAFAGFDDVEHIAVVAPRDALGHVSRIVAEWEAERGRRGGGGSARVTVVPGGDRRQDSVRCGLEVFWEHARWALVHDAARPLVERDDVRRVLDAVREHGAAALGYPASDSLKEERDGWVERSVPRQRIWQVQTPQGGSCEWFRRAYAELDPSEERTDEVSLLESQGVRARLVRGSRENLKLTLPEDFGVAEFLLSCRERAPEERV